MKPLDDAPKQQSPEVLDSVSRILKGLVEQGFYGTVKLEFEGGILILLRKTSRDNVPRDS
jgi:hypothetical protein